MTAHPLRVGFLGMGRRAQAFLRPLAAMDSVRIVAGADTWHEARLLAARLAPAIATYPTAHELLAAHPNLDLIFVCSRDHEHEDHVIAAFQSGAHVFCEKPLAITVAGCKRMIAAANHADKRLLVGFNLRFHPSLLEAQRFLDSGRLGTLRSIWEWHDVDLNYFHNWMSVRAYSAGLMLQKASHDFDAFNLMARAPATRLSAFGGRNRYGGDRPNDLHCPDCPDRETCPEAVTPMLFPGNDPEHAVPNRDQMKCAFRREIDVCDHHVVNLTFANGVTGSYTEVHGSPLNTRRFVLIGTEGRLEFEIHDRTFCWRPRNGKLPPEEWLAPEVEGGHGGADTGLVDALLLAIRQGTPFATEGEAGLQAVRMSVAAEESIRHEGRVIDLA